MLYTRIMLRCQPSSTAGVARTASSWWHTTGASDLDLESVIGQQIAAMSSEALALCHPLSSGTFAGYIVYWFASPSCLAWLASEFTSGHHLHGRHCLSPYVSIALCPGAARSEQTEGYTGDKSAA